MPRFGTLTAAPDGLRVDIDAPGGLPDGAWPLLSSGPIGPGGTVPGDTTVWASV